MKCSGRFGVAGVFAGGWGGCGLLLKGLLDRGSIRMESELGCTWLYIGVDMSVFWRAWLGQ